MLWAEKIAFTDILVIRIINLWWVVEIKAFFRQKKLIFEACITVVHYFAIHKINTVVNINEVTMLICCGIRHIEQSCFEVFGDYSSEQSYSKQILDISRHHFCEKNNASWLPSPDR